MNAVKTIKFSVLAVLCLLLSVIQVPGQEKRSGPQKLGHDVTVAVKLVQVYVTDKSGNPVGDLEAKDFEVFDNNKPVSLIHFEKHFGGQELGQPVQESMANRRFFLLFDFAFSDPRGVLKAKKAGLDFMETTLLPTDEIGLLTYSAFRGLVLHEYLTTDHQRVRNIIENFGLKNVTGRAENLSTFYYSDVLSESQELQDSLAGEDRFFSNQARFQTGQSAGGIQLQSYIDQVRFFFSGMSHLAKALRTVPGYKNIVLFSGGIARQILFGRTGGEVVGEWSTPEQLAAQLSTYDAAQADAGLREDFSQAIKDLKASNCPVFAFDTSQVHKGLAIDQPQGFDKEAREIDGVDSLRQMASGTGGRFYANTVDFGNAVEEVVDSTRSFYVLGYNVSEKWDGKFHKIKVRVGRKGLKVYSQGGYFSPRPFKDYDNFDKLLHLIDLSLSEVPQFQIPVEMPVDALNLSVKGWPRLVVFGRASGLDMTDILGRKSEAYLLLFDSGGDLVFIKKFRISVPKEAKKEAYIPSFSVSVKPGDYTCSLVMRDMNTGRGARGSVFVKVPKESRSPTVLDQPVLLSVEPNGLELVASDGPKLASLFGFEGESYLPLAGRVPSGAETLFAALRLGSHLTDGRIEIRARLNRKDNEEIREIPVKIIKESRIDDAMTLIVELAVGKLDPGNYQVDLLVGPEGGQSISSASAFFSVKD